MQFYLTVVWFHLKLCTKKDVDCFGQLPERKIWLAYVRLLSLPFLYLIWFTPTNFTVILKPLNNFFKKLDNPEINHQFTYPQGFKDIENKEGNGASNVTKFFPQILCFQVSVLIIHWHCFQVSYSRAQLEQKNYFAIKRTLQLLPGHIEESSY